MGMGNVVDTSGTLFDDLLVEDSDVVKATKRKKKIDKRLKKKLRKARKKEQRKELAESLDVLIVDTDATEQSNDLKLALALRAKEVLGLCKQPDCHSKAAVSGRCWSCYRKVKTEDGKLVLGRNKALRNKCAFCNSKPLKYGCCKEHLSRMTNGYIDRPDQVSMPRCAWAIPCKYRAVRKGWCSRHYYHVIKGQ